MHGAHVCMTGSPTCSGINPCDGCLTVVITHVLAPAMKAAGIDGRNDGRAMTFIQTYHGQRSAVLNQVLQTATVIQTEPAVPPPTIPPLADVPLTEDELAGMAQGAPPSELVSVDVDTQAATMPAPVAVAAPTTPPGLLSDEEFRERFPSVSPETVMEMPTPAPVPEPPMDRVSAADYILPTGEDVRTYKVARKDVPLPRKSEPSLLKLATQAITPTLPTDDKASDKSEVGVAPSPTPPSPASQPKALPDDVSAVPESANPNAENTTKEPEATTHG